MAALLSSVQWWSYHSGYATRCTVILDLREDAMARFADEEARQLVSAALSNGWIAEIGRTATSGPGYVLTRKGEAQLLRNKQRAA